jgi:hypothetical protein
VCFLHATQRFSSRVYDRSCTGHVFPSQLGALPKVRP